jgi:hypothetical protein
MGEEDCQGLIASSLASILFVSAGFGVIFLLAYTNKS